MDHHKGTVGLYTALDESKREIRLVSSIKIDSIGGVSCSLSKSDLDHSESGRLRYIALSYLWGDPKQTKQILVNGQYFEATHNLVAFLRHYNNIPNKYRDFPIWIDAICINQSDTDERMAQVKLMGDIYRGASASISWLGPISEDSHLAISSISLCAGYIRSATGGNLTDWLQHEIKRLGTVDYESFEGEGLPRNKTWAAIARFLRRPYWTRIWIYQEIVLPSHIVLLCGDAMLPSDDLLVFVDWMQQVDLKFGCPYVDQDIFPIYPWPQRLSSLGITRLEKHISNRRRLQIRASVRQEELCSLAEFYPVGLSATDPRDIVYGVLGALPIPIVPDYKKSVEEVYYELAAYLTTEGHLSSVLSQRSSFEKMRRKEGQTSTLELPSWIPDFSLHGVRQLSQRRPFVHADSIREAGGDLPHEVLGAFKPEPCGKSLRAAGVICEPIIEEPEVFSYVSAFEKIRKFLPEEESNSTKYYPTGIPIHQALVRILMKDPGIFRDDDDPIQIDIKMVLGFAIPVYESMLAPEQSTEELLAFWRRVGFQYEIPTHEELQVMLFGQRVNDAEGVIRYNKDAERYRALRRTAMFQLASWDEEYMFCTKNEYIGLSEGEVRSGDMLCVLFGCKNPVVLRSVGDYWQFISTCYVLGFMEGEAVQLVKDGKRTVEVFNIQ